VTWFYEIDWAVTAQMTTAVGTIGALIWTVLNNRQRTQMQYMSARSNRRLEKLDSIKSPTIELMALVSGAIIKPETDTSDIEKMQVLGFSIVANTDDSPIHSKLRQTSVDYYSFAVKMLKGDVPKIQSSPLFELQDQLQISLREVIQSEEAKADSELRGVRT